MESTEIMAMEEYTDLLPEEPRNIEVITGEILLFKAQAGASILEIGKRLIEVKAQLGHGEWLDYLKEKVEFSPRTAQDMMRLAKEYSNTQTFAFLGAQKALQLLALSAPEREEFVAKNDIENMSVRQLKEAIKAKEDAERERDEALEEAKAIRQDLMGQLEELQRAHSVSMEQAQAKLREACDNAEKARRAEVELKEKLKDLDKPRPADERELDAARKEAADKARAEESKKLKSQIEKAEQAAKKANEEKAKAEQAAAAAKAAYDQAAQIEAKEREQLNAEMNDLRKKLAMAGSSEMTIFKVHFEAMQEQANKMIECIGRAGENGNAELADKMRAAVKGCCNAIISGLGG